MDKADVTRRIKEKATELGFMACGVSEATLLDDEAKRLEVWLGEGNQGEMSYLERNFDKRVDPRKLVPGAKSVISVLHNYFTDDSQADKNAPRISKYAYGRDYHQVVREKLKQLLAYIREEFGKVEGRVFVDSAPVLEHAWAARSGLGWIGKNSVLLRRGSGSFSFLGEVILDLGLTYDSPVRDLCAKCKLCIDACPTGAIVAPRKIDARKCISYLTIECKDELPSGLRTAFGNRVFGCDACQDVCPYNRRAQPHNEQQFNMSDRLRSLTRNEWQDMTERDYEELFAGSAVKRTGFAGLRRNIDFVMTKDDSIE